LTRKQLKTVVNLNTDTRSLKHGGLKKKKNGRSYGCWAWLDGPNKLVFRGYVGIPLLGRNTHWRRVVMQAPAAGGLPYVLADPAH
jgi:uncharacterized protein (DUF2147 family)